MLVSVYIRKSDEGRWRSLENKTQAISDLLNSRPVKEGVAPRTSTVKFPTVPRCKIHGVPLTSFGKCLQKGCKYS